MDSLALHPVFSSTAAALLLWATAAAVSFFLIRKDLSFPPKFRTVLLGLRGLFLLIFALLLFRPSLLREGTVRLPASAAVLLDVSESMSIADLAGRPRYAASLEALDEGRRGGDEPFLTFFRFDEKTTPLAPDEVLPAEPTGKETAIGSALKTVLDRFAGKRLLGILLVSDGAQRTADPLAPQDAAIAARAAGVPIYTCTTGSADEADLRDVAVTLPAVPERAYLGNEVAVEGLLRASGYRGETIRLVLSADGEEVASRKFTLTSESQVVPYAFTYTSNEPGQKRLTVSADAMPGEITPSNNSADAYILFLRGNLRVLFLEGVRRFEDKFIRMALDAKQEISVDYVRLPDGQRVGEDQKYSAVIIGDIDPDDLDSAERAHLETVISDGAGLIFLAGLGSIAENNLSRIPFLASRSPIRLSDQTLDSRIAEEGFLDRPFRAAVAEGESAHYLARLAPESGGSKKIWDELPPLESILDLDFLNKQLAHKHAEKKPGAEVILTAADPDGKTFPLLLISATGERSALLLSDATWRWAMSEKKDAFETFWRQLVLWAAGRDVPAPGELEVEQSSAVLFRGEPARARILYMPYNPESADGVQISASVTTPGGEQFSFPLDQDRLGVFTQTDTPGEYVLSVEVNENGKKSEASRRFLVKENHRELENPAADTALLASLAEITHGEAIPPEKTADFFEKMRERKDSAVETIRSHRYLCDNWLIFALGVALLSAEWFLRKVRGRA
ncbi:MAG: hypothetical protein J6S40_07100 [Thermoguttaceae bacterium]|nr:hypothetical protein [Thermoguttaceae bacterium]